MLRHKKHEASDRRLWMGWWADGGPLLQASGIREVFEAVAELVPEALPSRWDVDEAYRHRMAGSGLDELIAFVHKNREFDGRGALLRVDPPASLLTILAATARWGTEPQEGAFEVPWIQLELDAAAVDGPGVGDRLAELFTRLATAIGAFYAEARLLRAGRAGRSSTVYTTAELPPVEADRWWGLPVKAPFAAILGPPYTELWPEFGRPGPGTLRVGGPGAWTREADALSWDPPPGLQQPVDCHYARRSGDVWDSTSVIAPRRRARVWPWQEHAAAWSEGYDVLEENLQVRLISAPGEPEVWVRDGDDPRVLGVRVEETIEAGWAWRVRIAAFTFVGGRREVPMRREVQEVLAELGGVEEIQPERREVWLVRGDSDGREIASAMAVVVDRHSTEIWKVWRPLGKSSAT